MSCDLKISLTELMVSHDLPYRSVTNQSDSNTIPEFEHTMDRRCQALVSRVETLGHHFYLTKIGAVLETVMTTL